MSSDEEDEMKCDIFELMEECDDSDDNADNGPSETLWLRETTTTASGEEESVHAAPTERDLVEEVVIRATESVHFCFRHPSWQPVCRAPQGLTSVALVFPQEATEEDDRRPPPVAQKELAGEGSRERCGRRQWNMKHLAAKDTTLYADCVAWCPLAGQQNVLAFGSYQLCGAERRGGLHFADTAGLHQGTSDGIETVTSFELPGVLDLKWGSRDTAAVTLADGSVRLVQCDECAHAKLVASTDTPTETVLMALDWVRDDLVTCGIDGKLHLWNMRSMELVRAWKAHDLEAWMVRLDPKQDAVWSGSDDGTLRMWDLRSPGSHLSSSTHDAGILD